MKLAAFLFVFSLLLLAGISYAPAEPISTECEKGVDQTALVIISMIKNCEKYSGKECELHIRPRPERA